MASIIDFFNQIEKFSYTQYCHTLIDGGWISVCSFVQLFREQTNMGLIRWTAKTGAHPYAIIILLHLGTVVFILSKVTSNYSWVDKLWSLLPIAFTAHLLYYQVHCDGVQISLRQSIMAAFVFVWGARLTYNFWRKGGYTMKGEDYRWVWIRENFDWFQAELLNFFFTSYYQLILIYWFTSPIYYASNQELNVFDIILFLVWIVLFLGETIADNQQWEFQTTKHKMLKQNGGDLSSLPEPYKRGYITDGLFKYSRHPNFFCQISMWWVIYLLSVSSSGVTNFSGIGALLLNLLFIGSSTLTEVISKQKYPSYREYVNSGAVNMLLPAFPKSNKKIIEQTKLDQTKKQ